MAQFSVSGKYIIKNDMDKEKVQVYYKGFDNLVATLDIQVDEEIKATHDLLFISSGGSVTCIGFDGKFHWIDSEFAAYVSNMTVIGEYLFVRYNTFDKLVCTHVQIYFASKHCEIVEKPDRILKSPPTKYKKHYYICSSDSILKLDKSLEIVAEHDLKDIEQNYTNVYPSEKTYYLITDEDNYDYNNNNPIPSPDINLIDNNITNVLTLRDDCLMVSSRDKSVISLRYGKFPNVLPKVDCRHRVVDVIKLDNVYRLVMTNETTFDIEIFKKEFSNFHLFSKKTRKRIVFLYWVLKKTFPKDLIECIILNAI